MEKKKKLIIIISIISAIIIICACLIIYFFNRSLNVTLKYKEGEKSFKIKYNQTIDIKKHINEEEIGDMFNGWYEVTIENGNEFISSKTFDFKTKIKKDTILEAKYDEEEIKEDSITITFDTRGGNEIEPITLKKGEELILPDNPIKEYNTFKTWEDKNNNPIYNKVLLSEDTTLYAVWEKMNEKINLSLTNKLIHPNGNIKDTLALVKLENTSDKVTYTLNDNTCASVDNDGYITLKNLNSSCYGKTIQLTASLPSGTKETANFQIERNIELRNDDMTLEKNSVLAVSGEYNITSNIDVTWKITTPNGYVYNGLENKTESILKGNFNCKTNNEETLCSKLTITATTKTGQSFKIELFGG